MILFKIDESTSTNVSSESKTTTRETFNEKIHSPFSPPVLSNNDIYTGLTNDENSIDSSEQILIDETEEMSRREKKMQERWELSTKLDSNSSETSSNKPLLGINFPPISVLRRKFSTSSTVAAEETKKTHVEEVSQQRHFFSLPIHSLNRTRNTVEDSSLKQIVSFDRFFNDIVRLPSVCLRTQYT